MRRHAAVLALALLAGCSEKTIQKELVAVHCAGDADCDDGVFCNGAETCTVATGACARGATPSCDDAVACTVDLCDEAQRACAHVPNSSACGPGERCTATGCGPAPECATGADCDDGLFCNGTETCGLDQRCHPGAAPACDDGVACTVDFCDDLLDRCAHVGDAWACAAGERCSPIAGCVAPAECAADADCDDRVFCNGTESCDLVAGRCKPGLRPDCDDGLACTVDVCDELLARCVSVSDATRCGAGQLCLPAQGCVTPAACAADADCDDGVFCNGAETCDPGAGRCAAGTPPACGDAVACNVDLCDEARRACLHVDEPATAGCTQLSVGRTGTGGGTVTSTPPGIACGATCTAWLEPSAVVTLSAANLLGSTFDGWGGACAGTPGNVCGVSMSASRTVTATFTRILHALTVNRTAGGTITSEPAGLYCGATCTASFGAASTVGLVATPEPGATFAGWTGACTGTAAACWLTLYVPGTVSARFTFPLAVSKAGTGGGVVSSSPAGIDCGSTCGASLDGGQTVTLTAVADGTSTFAGWSGACSGTGACLVSMDEQRSVTATFTRQVPSYTLTVNRSGEGTVSSTPGGLYCGADCAEAYASGTDVTLVPTPATGWTFAGWGGACTGTASCAVTMNTAKTVTATFVRDSVALSVSKAGAGTGTVTSSPLGLSCGATCTTAFPSGTVVALNATPDALSVFTGWSGACAGTGACLVTLDAPANVTATFGRASFPFTVSRAGTGGGTVTAAPAGIDCGSTCAATYQAGTTVTLTAVPDATSDFTGWSGSCTGASTSCAVTVDGAHSATATFARRTHTLTVVRNGGGTVTSSPGGVACGATCAAAFDEASVVTLTASPDPGNGFAGWSGACVGGMPTCTVTMSAAKSVTASFIYSVTVTKAGDGRGTVSTTPAGLVCDDACIMGTTSFAPGTFVQLTATPAPGSTFAGWTGACAGRFGCAFTPIDGAKSVTAMFLKQRFELLVLKEGTGDGTVTSAPAGLSCGGTCLASFDGATTVTLTATGDPASDFAGWSGACTGTGTCTVTMNATTGVVATFTLR